MSDSQGAKRVPMDSMRKTALVAGIFYPEQYGVVSATAVPIALWELSLGLWLTFKGFNRSAPIMVAAAADAGSRDDSTRAVPPVVPVAPAGGVA